MRARSVDILVDAVQAELFGAGLQADPHELVDHLPELRPLGRQHLVAPILHGALAALVPPDAPGMTELGDDRLSAVGNHLRTLADLARLKPVLESMGARWAVVKGPVLAEVFYPRPDLRSYDDLDVLVDPSQFGEVVDALESLGARLLDQNWPLIRSSGRGELSLVLWHGTVLDLHWDLITERTVRAGFQVRTRDLLDRTRMVDVASIPVPTLGVGDTLLYLALHSLLAGGDRLGWFADVSAVMSVDGALTLADWRRAEVAGTALPAAIILDRVRRVIGDPHASTSLANAPRTPSWGRLVALSDRMRPPEMLPRALSMRILARSTRGTSRRSLTAGARSVLDDAALPLLHQVAKRRRPGVRPDGGADATNPLWVAAGTAADRRESLRDFARHAGAVPNR